MTGVVLLTSSIGVQAARAYPSGGLWDYGVYAIGSASIYYHGTRTHSATITKGGKSVFDKKAKTQSANARMWTYSGCAFYYNVY